MKINNLPERTEQFIVSMEVDGELWFYGSFANREKAEECAAVVAMERNLITHVHGEQSPLLTRLRIRALAQ